MEILPNEIIEIIREDFYKLQIDRRNKMGWEKINKEYKNVKLKRYKYLSPISKYILKLNEEYYGNSLTYHFIKYRLEEYGFVKCLFLELKQLIGLK